MEVLDRPESKVVEKKRENIVNNDPKLFEVFEIGDVSMQGDICLIRISKLPKSARRRSNTQLAEGNTQGSRHVVANGQVYDHNFFEVQELIMKATGKQVDPAFIGPVFVSPDEPSAHDLTHPEHGHQGFPAGSVIATVHQRTVDTQRRMVRVHD